MPIRKNIHNMPQGLPNPGFMQEKVQKGDFLKKPSWELKFFCCFRFLWIYQRPGTLNWKWLVFLLSKILYMKCGMWAKVFQFRYLMTPQQQNVNTFVVIWEKSLYSYYIGSFRFMRKEMYPDLQTSVWQWWKNLQ